MQHAFPVVLLVICIVAIAGTGIYKILVQPISRKMELARSKREYSERKLHPNSW